MEPATIATRGKPLRVNAADTAIAIEPRELTIDPRTYATPLDAALAAVHEANDAWKKSRSGTTIIDDDDDDNLRVRVDVLTSKTDSGTVDDVVGLLESTGLFWKDAVGDDIVPQVEAPPGQRRRRSTPENSPATFYLSRNGELIGAVVARQHEYEVTSYRSLSILEVPILRIISDEQKKGHGSRLMGVIYDFAQHLGSAIVFVPVAESALGFYAKMQRVMGVTFDAGTKLGFARAHFNDMYSNQTFESHCQYTAQVIPGRFALTVHKALEEKRERVAASHPQQKFTSLARACADMRAILKVCSSTHR